MNGESAHDLLLALAGRVDDDLLAWCRELVAVGEDGRAVALACATLAADRVALPADVRAALVAQAAAARTDLDVDRALLPALDEVDGTPHRFDAALPVVDALATVVAGLPARQVEGCRLHATARTTPAGTAPGPLPQAVLLVLVDAGDPRPADVLGYQLAISCARAGVPAAVEVVAAGRSLPAYQDAALRAARPVLTEDADTAPVDAPVPAVDVVPDEPEDEPASRSSLADRMAAWDSFDAPDADEPEPAPLSFDAPEETPDVPADRPRWPASGSLVLPSLPRRRPTPEPAPVTPLHPEPNGHRPPAEPPRTALPLPTGPDTPALAALGDPFGDAPTEPHPAAPEPDLHPGPTIDESDPLGLGHLPLTAAENTHEEPGEPVADSWLADWLTGDWAMPASGPSPQPSTEPAPPPVRPSPRPSPRPAPAPAPDPTEQLLRPESVARLTEDDRELLARLQSELGAAPRPRVTRRAGIAPNGTAPRPVPPDDAG